MLLGDAHVEGALGEAFAEQVEAGAGRHGGGDGDDLVVFLGRLDQAVGEHAGVAGSVAGRLGLFAGDDVELGHRMVFVVRVLGRGEALALLGDHVDQHRTVGDLVDVLQHRHQMIEVVAVDRTHVIKAQLFEEGAAGGHAPGELFGLARRLLQRFWQGAGHPAAQAAEATDRARRTLGGPDRRSCRPPADAIDISLSLRTTISCLVASAALFIAS